MEMVLGDKFRELYEELWLVSRELLQYYDVDKVKSYSVYVWTKEENEDFGENVFDIEAGEIVFYDNSHKIIEEALPIIKNIQAKLKKIEDIN